MTITVSSPSGSSELSRRRRDSYGAGRAERVPKSGQAELGRDDPAAPVEVLLEHREDRVLPDAVEIGSIAVLSHEVRRADRDLVASDLLVQRVEEQRRLLVEAVPQEPAAQDTRLTGSCLGESSMK